MPDEPLADAQSLDEHLARQLGRFDDAFLWQERAHATRGGWPARFRGIDRRPVDKNLWWLYDYNLLELRREGRAWLEPISNAEYAALRKIIDAGGRLPRETTEPAEADAA